MIRVCVLGSIASGKSFISKLFNCPIFNADKEVIDIYKKDKNCFTKLNNKFPDYVKSFPIKKTELINVISSNNKSLKLISSIVHPIVRKRMKKFLKEKKNSKMIVLDIPLLLENKLNKKNDVLVFVNAQKKKILARVKKRRYNDKKILKHLKQNQSNLFKKRKLANYVIDNNFAPNIMKQKVNLLKKKILYERNSS
tara:strand:- start:1507 stop:2094 length:588 start_codon:yes stop_codon:yes gene_type:complete